MATIQVRNLPDDTVRAWKVRAAKRGQSLQEYMLHHLVEEAERPTVDELFDEIEARGNRRFDMSAETVVNAIHDDREARTRRVVDAAKPKIAK